MENLLTLQDLFDGRIFKVPNYQRGYSWEKSHRNDLREDLESMNRKRHYTGTIVLKESVKAQGFGETYKRFDIVDGQQRITTLIIFLNHIVKELVIIDTEESKEIAGNIMKKYIKYKGPMGSIYKLELDLDNEEFFKQRILIILHKAKKYS